jgi:type II secretory ATPase GspE/PulE/Tfp pilus assembly ATPase PilB-like protein
MSLDAEGVRVRGWRSRYWFYEDLSAVRADDASVWLTRTNGQEDRVRSPDARDVAARLGRILSAPQLPVSRIEWVERLEAWLSEPGLATVPVVDWILRSAVAVGASDLHLTPQPDGARITARIDGTLAPIATLTSARCERIMNRIKVLAGLRLHRTDLNQEGRIALDAGQVRVGFTPGVDGETCTARLFDRLKGEATFDTLGLTPDVRDALVGWLGAARGAVLFAGPSASGKTTTLYTALRHCLAQANGTMRAVTVEDPVEYRLPDVVQLEADPARGLSGATLLRAALRHDADLLMVGEVRDAESAQVLVDAALTGHLALGTIHAGCAAEAVQRMRRFGVEPEALQGVLHGVIAQRLIRLPCACESGCAACQHTGYLGRTAVAEALSMRGLPAPLPTGRAAIRAGAGLEPLADRARGRTDAPEIERVFA